jgi:hypothetical protein
MLSVSETSPEMNQYIFFVKICWVYSIIVRFFAYALNDDREGMTYEGWTFIWCFVPRSDGQEVELHLKKKRHVECKRNIP